MGRYYIYIYREREDIITKQTDVYIELYIYIYRI